MRNIAMRLRYEGTRYHGWQMQDKDITVQQVVEEALEKVLKAPARLHGCGRTDAGVHALRYCANFKTEARIPADKLHLAMNAHLPGDVAVCDAVDAPEDFNAILSCEKKEYTYYIYNSNVRDPFLDNRAWFYPQALDAGVMAAAAAAFVGMHDFAAVRSVGTDLKSTVRTIYWFEVERQDKMISLKVCADGFLYNMVRAMVGTAVYASLGKLRPEDIPAILDRGDRCLAGPTAPPQGLYMTGVWYPGKVGEMMRK